MNILTQLPDWFTFDKLFLKLQSLNYSQKVKKNMNQFVKDGTQIILSFWTKNEEEALKEVLQSGVPQDQNDLHHVFKCKM